MKKQYILLLIDIVSSLLVINTGYAQTPNDPLYSQQTYLNNTNVPQTWLTTQGNANQKIAILSLGGVNIAHEDLSPRVVIKTTGSPAQFVGAADPDAGIIGAATNNGKGIAGVNWVAPILSYDLGKVEAKTVEKLSDGTQIQVDIMDLNTGAISSDIYDAVNSGAKTILIPLTWASSGNVSNYSITKFLTAPVYMITNPIGYIFSTAKDALKATFSQNNDYKAAANAVKNAYVNGVVVVGKAVNYDGHAIGFPAELSSDHIAVGVGSSDLSGQFYEYSSTPESDGTSHDPNDIDVIAPGVNMETTLAGTNQYGTYTGTDASAALATGIISLLQAANPSLTTDDIKFILHKTAAPIGGGGYNIQSGYGRIDAGSAMNYVNSHTIAHGIITNGSTQKIYSNRIISLFTSAWGILGPATGAYVADIYKVTFTISLNPNPFTEYDVWYDASDTWGWSAANPNDQNRYADVQYQHYGSSQATVTTYIYHILSNAIGQENGWYPTDLNNLRLGYTVSSKPITQNTDNIFVNDATISSNKTYSNEDLYLKDGVTLTLAAQITLNNCTVHLGTGATIQTTGSGKILATGTTFKPLSGNNSDHWAHILLNGLGGDQFSQCTFNGADQAIYENSYNDSFNRCTFQYNGTGIYAVSGLTYVTGSTISFNTDYGIYLAGTSEIDTDAYQSGSTFTPTVISNNPVGVYLTDSSWGVLFYSRIESNPYGIKCYNSSHLEAGHYDYPDADEGWNRFDASLNYHVYNSSTNEAWARDNYYGGYAPPSFDFYGSVDYGNALTYDPTISGAQGTTLQAMGTGITHEMLTAGTSESLQNTAPLHQTTATSTSSYQTKAAERVKEIFAQLNAQPDAPGNSRLLQEAYTLVHLYDPADSTGLWSKLDTYSSSFKAGMQLATSDITGGKLQASSPAKSIVISEASKQMGKTAALLKMDRLLQIGKWNQVQTLAEQISPYIQGTTAKSALLADRAVAWQHQKQFAKALAAYQAIEALTPDSGLSSHYEAPNYKIIEATLQDSMKAYSQKPESLVSVESGGNSELMVTDNKQLPTKFSLDNSYPNPFNPTTTIPFSLPQAAHVRIQIYNIMGQQVATLTNRQYQAGKYQVRFDGKGFASGIYFIRARLGKKIFTQRMTLIK